jgi:hypothetical protein
VKEEKTMFYGLPQSERKKCYLSVMTAQEWDCWLSYKADFYAMHLILDQHKTYYPKLYKDFLGECPVCMAFTKEKDPDYLMGYRPCGICMPGEGRAPCAKGDYYNRGYRLDKLIEKLEKAGVFDD